MIGMILIAHNRIAGEMLAAAEHVLGKQPLISILDVEDSDRPEQLQVELASLIRQNDTGDGVFILADMFGGTPCNIAIGYAEQGKVEVLSGFNLPSLIKALSLRKEISDVAVLAREVVAAGQQYMCLASEYMLKQNSSDKKEGGRTHG